MDEHEHTAAEIEALVNGPQVDTTAPPWLVKLGAIVLVLGILAVCSALCAWLVVIIIHAL